MITKTSNILPLIAALALTVLVPAFAQNLNRKADPMNASLEPLKGPAFEQNFLQQMIQHHRMGIEMAKLVSDHTRRPELSQFAEKMIASQQQEIDEMINWLKEWFNVSPKQAANETAGREMNKDLSMLSSKQGVAFEKSFLVAMLKRHQMAVETCEQAEKKAVRVELKEFAAKIAKDQQEEIKQLKNWAQSWFGPV